MTLYPHQKPQRPSTCHRHPTQPVTGFCASCLRERLGGDDPATSQEISSVYQHCNVAFRSRKSGSDVKAEEVPCSCELPRRKSCDVRFRNTLWDLFNIDDEKNGEKKFEVEMGSLGFVVRENVAGGRELMVDAIDDSVEEEIELKTMREFIDLEFRKKKKTRNDVSDTAGNLLESVSVFIKKLRKCRLKQKRKSIGATSGRNIPEKKTPVTQSVRRLMEIQSEVGDYGLGRRSYDSHPRFSVEAGRISMDHNPEHSEMDV